MMRKPNQVFDNPAWPILVVGLMAGGAIILYAYSMDRWVKNQVKNSRKILDEHWKKQEQAEKVDMSKVTTDPKAKTISGIEINLPVDTQDIMGWPKTISTGHYCEHCGNWHTDKYLIACAMCPPGNLYCGDCLEPHADEAHTKPLGIESHD